MPSKINTLPMIFKGSYTQRNKLSTSYGAVRVGGGGSIRTPTPSTAAAKPNLNVTSILIPAKEVHRFASLVG